MAVDDDETEIMSSERLADASGSEDDGGTIDEPSLSGEETAESSDVRLAAEETEASSDVRIAAEETLAAPTFPKPLAKGAGGSPREFELEPGERICDFEVIEVLGRGAFGVVYLARQVSLDRRVALKVTANRGSEGRTMARLEHDHVVQVFSEDVDDTGHFRLLCMQLVPGSSLDAVIRALRVVTREQGDWAGADYLAAIDERTQVSETFDPSALRDRELLDDASGLEAAAWVGARLAEAINFAHINGVLHRDIKPANVLINQYGRPMLADFNISFRSAPTPGGEEGEDKDTTFGGTLAFMAPEHLEAFDPRSAASAELVDERSDIYSLGIVVFELLSGRPPFSDPKREVSRTRYVAVLAESRREAPAPIEPGAPSARKVLQHTVAKALSPEKEERYQTGEEFAAALDGCRRLASVERALPPATSFTRAATRRPLLWAMVLIFLPQVIGSIVNITYNNYQIVGLLNESQSQLFKPLVKGYNAVVYPAALATLAYFFWPVFKTWKDLEGAERLDAERINKVRRAALRLPLWVLVAAAVGWLPGGLLFPTVLHWRSGPVDSHVFAHFFVSFSFSWLIAVAYSFSVMQYIALRVLYPRLWVDATDFEATARRELAGTTWRLWFAEIAAFVVPIVANLLFALLVSEQGAIPLRSLILSLTIFGMFGFIVVRIATGAMAKTHVVLTGQG